MTDRVDDDGEAPRMIAAALRFIAAVRTDPQLRERLARLEPAAGLPPVVALAREAGFTFSVDDLRRAFAVDWGLRRARYLREDAPDSAASTVAVVHSPQSGR